jgi:hypothetical protein
VELLLIHNSWQSKISDQQVCVILWGSEQEILWLQVAMYDAMVMEVCDSGEGRSHEICGVGFVIVALSANAIKQLASERKIGD